MSFWSDLRFAFSSPYTRGPVIMREIERVKTLESALRTIREAIPGYLKGEMSEHDFALVVLGEADSAKVNKALEKGK